MSAEHCELPERERYGHAAERATEEILGDLFTSVLDWSVGALNRQVGYAGLLLTRLGIKYLIVGGEAARRARLEPTRDRAGARAGRALRKRAAGAVGRGL